MAQVADAAGVPAETVGASLASVAVVAPSPLALTPQAREAASAASVVVIAAGAAAAALALAAGAALFYRAQQHALLERQQAAALSLRRKLAASKGQGHIEMSNPLLANNSRLKGRGRAMHALVPQTSAVRAASIRAQRTSTAAAGKGRSVVSALGLPPPAPRPAPQASTAPENEGGRATDGSVTSGAVKAPRVSLAPVAMLHHGARERPAAAQLSKTAAEEWLRIVEDDGDVYWEHKASGEQTREEPPSHTRAREAKAAADAAARRR